MNHLPDPEFESYLSGTVSSGANEFLDFPATQHQNIWNLLTDREAANELTFLPLTFPDSFDNDFFQKILPRLSLAQISTLLMRKFLPRYDLKHSLTLDDPNLSQIAKKAHPFEIPLEEMTAAFDEDLVEKVLAARLDSGPTMSDSDFGASVLAELLEFWGEAKQTQKQIILAASGNNAAAIAAAFSGLKWVKLLLIYPREISPQNEAQIQQAAKGSKNVECRVTRSDLATAKSWIKTLREAREAALSERAQKLGLESIGDKNFFGLLGQVSSFFSSYAEAAKSGQIKAGEKVVFALEENDLSALAAGFLAKKLGLPVEKFVVGGGENDMFLKLIKTGWVQWDQRFSESEIHAFLDVILELARREASPKTQINWDNLRRDWANPEKVNNGIKLEEYGVNQEILKYLAQEVFADHLVNIDESVSTLISQVHQNTQIILESRSARVANALEVAAESQILGGKKVICLLPESPQKSPETVSKAEINLPRKIKITGLTAQRGQTLKSVNSVLEAAENFFGAKSE